MNHILEIKAERRGLGVRNCFPQFIRHAALLLFTVSYCALIKTEEIKFLFDNIFVNSIILKDT